MTIALPTVIYVHRTHETHERLTRRGVADFDLMEIDRAIDSAVHRTHDESERGGWPDVDDDHTWSRYIEPLVLDYLDLDPDTFGEPATAHDAPAPLGAAL